MKFPVPVTCSSCGCVFTAVGHGEDQFPPATCPECQVQIHIIDPLSISVVADRLLYRSKGEISAGDYTLSIICSAMAVESALTSVYQKWKGLEIFKSNGRWATEDERNGFELEYRRQTSRGGFERSANFVSNFLCAKIFDDFVTDFILRNRPATLIKSGFPQVESQLKTNYVQQELFLRRNRIMHWGKVDYQKEQASLAFSAAYSAFAVLKVMDKEKNDAAERAWRESQV